MIKNIKLSDKNVRKFRAKRKWSYSSMESTNELVLEQEVITDNARNTQIPLFSDINNKISLEQSEITPNVQIRFAKKTKGTFFPKNHPNFDRESELLNKDGTYCRTVYDSINHLFYNNYGISEDSDTTTNPLMVFGSETGYFGQQPSEFDTVNSQQNLKQEIRN